MHNPIPSGDTGIDSDTAEWWEFGAVSSTKRFDRDNVNAHSNNSSGSGSNNHTDSTSIGTGTGTGSRASLRMNDYAFGCRPVPSQTRTGIENHTGTIPPILAALERFFKCKGTGAGAGTGVGTSGTYVVPVDGLSVLAVSISISIYIYGIC